MLSTTVTVPTDSVFRVSGLARLCSVVAAALLLLTSPLATADEAATTKPATQSATQPAEPASKPAGPAFTLNDPKGVNAIGFFVDSKLEPILGIGGGVGGTVYFDPANPEAFTGKITLSAEKLVVNNDAMTNVMHGAEWLGVADHPLVTLDIADAHVTGQGEGSVVLHAHGTLTLAGVTKEMEVTIAVSHIKDGAKARGGAESGDLVVLRSNFVVNREDFGIKVGMPDEKVGKEVMIVAAIVGYEK